VVPVTPGCPARSVAGALCRRGDDRPFVYARSRLVEKVIKVDPVNDGQKGAIESLRSESASLDTMGGAPFFVVLTDSKAKIR
jgi:hypothetical protein